MTKVGRDHIHNNDSDAMPLRVAMVHVVDGVLWSRSTATSTALETSRELEKSHLQQAVRVLLDQYSGTVTADEK